MHRIPGYFICSLCKCNTPMPATAFDGGPEIFCKLCAAKIEPTLQFYNKQTVYWINGELLFVAVR